MSSNSVRFSGFLLNLSPLAWSHGKKKRPSVMQEFAFSKSLELQMFMVTNSLVMCNQEKLKRDISSGNEVEEGEEGNASARQGIQHKISEIEVQAQL